MLVVSPCAATVQPMLSALHDQSIRGEHVQDVVAARAAFSACGGHRLLVVAPDVTPGAAAEVVDSLRAVDPGLVVALYGNDHLRGRDLERVHRFGSYHLRSRAGIGALLKLLSSM